MTSPKVPLEHAMEPLDRLESLSLPMPPYFAMGSDLSGDHPSFPVLSEAMHELSAALERSETHYTDVIGIAPLRREVARLLAELGLGERQPETVLISAGEQEARFIALQTLARAGYTFLLPSVVHPGARKAAAVAAPSSHLLTVDETLAPTVEDVRKAFARGGPAALYLEVPNRFTGRVLDAGRLEELATEVRRGEGMIVVDAGVAPWLLPGLLPPALAASEMAERLWVLGSLFPGTGADGWLSGYLAVPAPWAVQAKSLKQIVAICTAAPVQWAALGALRVAGDHHPRRRETLSQLKGEALRRLPQRAALPGEAVTILAVNISAGSGSLDALPFRSAPGEAFGLPGAIRLTITPTGQAVAAADVLAARLAGRPGEASS